MSAHFPFTRLRRLRRTPTLRHFTATPEIGLTQMIWPVFLVEGKNYKEPILSLPGQFRYSIDCLIKDLEPLVQHGLAGVMLFGIVEESQKTATATAALDPKGVVPQAIIELKKRFPDLLVLSDICVCEYTSHGHCGILNSTSESVDNDLTLNLLSEMALLHAQNGVDGVAPSAMMDGQVSAIRQYLEQHGLVDTILMSYSSKFASSMYGPFRDAAQSSPGFGNRKGYQADPAAGRIALLESMLDEAEGADILMVKPALFYMDIINQLRQRTLLPIAAYNVSGEYAMIQAAANQGVGDLSFMVRESNLALARAGTDILITYWANRYLEWMN